MSVDTPSVWVCGEMVPRNDVVSIVVSADAHSNKIKDHTFSKCSELNKVVLNEGVQRIGRNAFSYCESLESITLPLTVTEIDNYAFQHCTKLKEIILNKGLKRIGTSAFYKCTELREVVFHDGLERIGSGAFDSCKSLESITFPSTLTEIGKQAFINCINLRKVQLHEGLAKIGVEAFNNCESLQSITLPSTLEHISDWVFNGCRNLNEVVLNEGIQRIGSRSFQFCTSLQNIVLPSTVKGVDQYAFGDCGSLREVVVHDKRVQNVVNVSAFRGCTSLMWFRFPGLSTRLDNIIQAGQTGIEVKMDDIPTLEWRGGELALPATHRQVIDRWGVAMESLVKIDKEKLDKVKILVAYYEMKEATTLFELALWKARIDEADSTTPSSDRVEPAFQDTCRIEVPGPVKEAIMQYLN